MRYLMMICTDETAMEAASPDETAAIATSATTTRRLRHEPAQCLTNRTIANAPRGHQGSMVLRWRS